MNSYATLIDNGKIWRIEITADKSIELQINKEHLAQLLAMNSVTISIDYTKLFGREAKIAITGFEKEAN